MSSLPPDVTLFIACAALSVITYFLWSIERLPRFRKLTGFLALICFVACIVVYNEVTPVPAPPGAPELP